LLQLIIFTAILKHEFVRSRRKIKSLLSTDGSGGKALDESNIHHVPWMFSNLPVDCCSACMPEVSTNNLPGLCHTAAIF